MVADILYVMNKVRRTNDFLFQDILIIIASIIFAAILVRTDILTEILASIKELQFLGSFIAGLFFTSVFTTAPAIVALGEISLIYGIVPTAFFGAIGSVIGDLIIFNFIRDRFSEHLLEVFQHKKKWKRLRVLLKSKIFHWLSLFIGALILASPFPDELGISLFGFSKIKVFWVIILSFVFNFLGIILIGVIAHAI